MKRGIQARVDQLERTAQAVAIRVAHASPAQQAPADIFRHLLSESGVEPGPHESLAETTARALGITYVELRDRLEQIACGREGW